MSTIYTFHTECPAVTADGLAAADLLLLYDASAGTTKRALVSDVVSYGNAPVAVGATLTLTKATHSGKTMLLDTAAGSIATLPAATGTGAKFKFVVSVLATSNSHIIKVANATDVMIGMITSVDDTSDNAVGFIAGATADTITLNRSTTGSVSKGEWIEIEDVASGIFHVRGTVSNSGTPATQFSATVS